MLLHIEDLHAAFCTPLGCVPAVAGLSLQLDRGRTLALVGESGCGKTVTALAILGLLPPAAAGGTRGSIRFDGCDLLALPPRQRRLLRGRRIAMIFQEPMTCLNPVLTIGAQLAEVGPRCSRRTARARGVEQLRQVGLADPARRLRQYPHELSGGMRQRVLIAMALAAGPDLLIADEPTTALDVTVQAQILDLLRTLQQRSGMAMLFITHDLGVVAEIADDVAVMYAGRIVEQAPLPRLLADPRHPYTRGLLACTPRLADPAGLLPPIFPAQGNQREDTPAPLSPAGQTGATAAPSCPPPAMTGVSQRPLPIIPGEVPDPVRRPAGCAFHPRCTLGAADPVCRSQVPELRELAPGHACACWKA
jgi:oligopeptide/dipeptide ABC transporter ATP-binding protein